MRRRTLVVPPLTLLASLVVVECAARALNTDQLQHEAIAVAAGRGLGETTRQRDASAWIETTRALGVDYLPDEFVLEEGGFHSRWGFCDFDHPGPTILAMGDSTTRQTMVERDGQRSGDMPQNTWPKILEQRLGGGAQVCVAAENGYHPGDLARLLEALQPRLEPELVLALLCDNDLMEIPARVRVERDDVFVFYRAVDHALVVAAWYWYPLYVRSEAYRFLLWRTALAFPGSAGEIDIELPDAIGVELALQRLDASSGELGVYFLPTLDDGSASLAPRLQELEELSGVIISAVVLPSPRSHYRRTPEDSVHMNSDGHRAVVDAMLPLALQVVQGAGGPSGSQP